MPAGVVWIAVLVAVVALAAWLVNAGCRARARLAASEAQMRLVTDAAPLFICYVDADQRYRFVNRRYAERHGRAPEELLGRSVAEIVGPARYAQIAPRLEAALSGRPLACDWTGPGPAAAPEAVTYVPDTAPDGRVQGVVVVIADISERQRAEDERARLLTLEQRRRREAEAIAELSRLLAQGADLESVAQRVADLSRALLGTVAATVYRLDPETGDLVSLAVAGDMGPFGPGGVLPRGSGAAGLAVERRRPVATPDVLCDPAIPLDPATRTWIEQATYRAVLAVPLLVKGRTVGAYALGDRAGRGWSEDEVRLATALADHATVALENVRLFTEAEERRREAERLAELTQVVNGSLDLDTMLGRVVEAARELCAADIARITLWDDERRAMVYRATVGTRFTGYARIIVAPGRGLGGEVLATGRPVRTANAATDPRVLPEHGSLVREEGSVAVMVAPIRAGARIEGLIYVDRRTPRPFGERDETVLLRLADHAAIALRNAQAFAGEQVARSGAEAQAGRARLVADASRVLAASHDYEATLARVARLVVPALADWSMVYLARRDGGVRRLAVAHADPDQAALAAEIAAMPATVNWQRDTSGTVRALREGEPILVVHVSAEVAGWDQVIADPDDRRIMRAIRPASLLLVPLVARGRTLGAMTWMRGGGRPAFTREDLALAGDVAARAALAVDNARLYRQAERARVDAERANRAKDEFLAVLSHELRTPLTSMLGWLRLLRTGQLAPEKTAQALEVVERNTRSQAQLINDLLDVSRIVAGKLQLDRYPVDLVPIVELAVESSRREAETREIALGLFADPGAGPVLGDPLRISQIVVNLLTNAVKFTPPGGRVEVRLARDGDHAVITVADTGIGIEPDVLPTVFDRFRQADSTITRRHGGLGLGLAIVRHLTELHGGRVKAESAGAGQGSTFTVRLPLTAARREGPAERPAAPGAATALAGLRVLLVEDHADTADLIRAILEGQGAAVRIATSLAGALDALADAPADMLISDIAMPDGTGFDLVRQLRAAERADNRPPLAAIALTAFAGADDRERGLAAGFQDYAAKPVEPTALVEIVARAAGRLVPKY